MRKFYDSTSFRRHEHDRISTALAGGHDDDTSCCSLSVDCRTPNFQIREGGTPAITKLYMYYGNDLQYEVKKVSDIKANDYVFAHRTNSSQDQVDMIAIYKACSKALDDGMFVFRSGEFDCGNKYLEAANLYDPDKPWIQSDRLFPYYFRSSSPIRGRVTWDEVISDDFGTRYVFVVNTDVDEDLAEKIPDGSIIYIGGDHSREQLGFASQYRLDSVDWDLPLKMDTSKKKFLSCNCRHCDSQNDLDCSVFDARLFSSSLDYGPTWDRASQNRSFCLSLEVDKVCWPTTADEKNVRDHSPVLLSAITLSFIKTEAGFIKSDSVTSMENITVDAMKMRGFYIKADELEGQLFRTMLNFLGSGADQFHGDSSDLNSGLMSWLMRLLRSSELMNTGDVPPTSIHSFKDYGLYELVGRAKMNFNNVTMSASNSASLSRGVLKSLINYAVNRPSGVFEVGEQAPGGEYMCAIVFDVNKGLSQGCFLTHHKFASVMTPPARVLQKQVCWSILTQTEERIAKERVPGSAEF